MKMTCCFQELVCQTLIETLQWCLFTQVHDDRKSKIETPEIFISITSYHSRNIHITPNKIMFKLLTTTGRLKKTKFSTLSGIFGAATFHFILRT